MYRSILFAIGISIWSLSGWAGETVRTLERELVEMGESGDLLFRLATAYAEIGDAETASLYLNYVLDSHPDYAAQHLEEIATLRERIGISTQLRSRSDSFGLYQLSAGMDSNATQGTALSQLDLVLANGETLVLAVDDHSRAISSAYLGAKAAGMADLGESISLRAAVEHVAYRKTDVEPASLGSLELIAANHTLAGYVFDRYGTRTGLAYQGAVGHFFWGGQRDNQQRRVFAGVQGALPVLDYGDLRWSIERFSGSTEALGRLQGVRLNAGFEVNRFGIEYSMETARYANVFDPVFFPTVRDRYLWHRFDVSLPLAVTEQRRFDVVVAYNDKQHDVSLNSWRGIDFRLVLSAPLE